MRKTPYRKRLAKEMMSDLWNPASGLKGLPGTFINEEDWTFTEPSDILAPLYNQKHQIVGVRIRMDYMNVN